ncbi:hypothetical protein GCM10010520_55700 [Rhizobium viscosum]
MLDDVHSIFAIKVEIDDDKVDIAIAEKAIQLGPRFACGWAKARFYETFTQQFTDRRIVVDDDNVFLHGGRFGLVRRAARVTGRESSARSFLYRQNPADLGSAANTVTVSPLSSALRPVPDR